MLQYVVVILLLYADGLIKLHRAGVLDQVAETFSCIISEAVYHEAVTQGKARMYPDAEAIEEIIKRSIFIKPSSQQHKNYPHGIGSSLGIGERSILALYPQDEPTMVVSDDRSFLSLLSRQNIPFLVPAALIVILVRQGGLPVSNAKVALERLRPWIRESVYIQAVSDLE